MLLERGGIGPGTVPWVRRWPLGSLRLAPSPPPGKRELLFYFGATGDRSHLASLEPLERGARGPGPVRSDRGHVDFLAQLVGRGNKHRRSNRNSHISEIRS